VMRRPNGCRLTTKNKSSALYLDLGRSGVVEEERGGTPFPHFFSEGERDPSLFCSISGIFSAEINEQRRL